MIRLWSASSIRRPSALVLTGVATMSAFVLVTGVTAALTVPAVAITAQASLPEMLPANTALYVTADLNPTSSSRVYLSQIGRAFMSEPGWSEIKTELGFDRQDARAGGCMPVAIDAASDLLGDLGHDTAFALLPAPRAREGHGHLRRLGVDRAIARNFVILAPLDVRMTLADAIHGFAFSMPKRASHYRGISIYREDLPSCGISRRLQTQAYYAAVFKGYVLLGLAPLPIREVIDAGSGRRRSLASRVGAAKLLAELQGRALGGFYINGPVLDRSISLLKRVRRSGLVSRSLVRVITSLGSAAGAVTLRSDGLSLTFVHARSAGLSPDPAAKPDVLSSALASATPLYASFTGPPRELRRAMHWLQANGLSLPSRPVTAAVVSTLSSGVDLVQLRDGPSRSKTARLAHPQFFALWNIAEGQSHVAGELSRALKENREWQPVSSRWRHGVLVVRYEDGSGYAVGPGWSLVSAALSRGLFSINSKSPMPLAHDAGFPTGAETVADTRGLWYVDVQVDARLIARAARSIRWLRHDELASPALRMLGAIQSIGGSLEEPPGPFEVVKLNIQLRQDPAEQP